VLCVGHEPFLSEAEAALVSRDGRVRIEMKKSGVAGLDFEGRPAAGAGTLLYHFRPRELLVLMKGGARETEP
jgi:phosphohistidine phosphatase SixA